MVFKKPSRGLEYILLENRNMEVLYDTKHLTNHHSPPAIRMHSFDEILHEMLT